MAMEMTIELRAKLRRANADEVEAILAEAGQEATPEEIERFKYELNRAAEHDGERLSLDELDAVAGGDALWQRSYSMGGAPLRLSLGAAAGAPTADARS